MSGKRINVVDQLLDPLIGCLTPEVARRIVALKASHRVETRLPQLADNQAPER